MNYQTSRHLWLNRQEEKIAVANINSEQRLLLTPKELTYLERYCQGAELSDEFSRRLAAADLIVPVENKEQAPENSRLKIILFTIDRFLANHLGIKRAEVARLTPEPLDRIKQTKEIVFNQLAASPEVVSASARTEWDDFEVLFNHVETFLKEDALDPGPYHFPSGFLTSTSNRPLLRYDYEQQPCMPATTVARIEFVRPKLKPESSCLILGDDDLLGLYWSQTLEQPVDIFELDADLISFLQPQLRPGASIIQRDLINGLAEEFRHRYDAVFTDPMYRAEGMDLFMLCAASGLSKSLEARVYFTTQPDLIQDGKRFKERLERAGLSICEQHKNFSRYRFPNFARNMVARKFASNNISNQLIDGLLRIPYLYADLFVLKSNRV